MARDKTRFKALVNRLLDMLEPMQAGQDLGSEEDLAQRLEASRTTVRAVLRHLAGQGVLSWDGRRKTLLRVPVPADRFDDTETRPRQDHFEVPFLEWVLQGDLPPGTALNEADLARRFDVPVATVRAFLIRFEPFGLIEKRPNRHWVLKGFTRGFAQEMFTVRAMFERHALSRLLDAIGQDAGLMARLRAMRDDHQALSARPDRDLQAFPALDARFHSLICAASGNRFIHEFSRTISIIVHFHYRWNKRDELRRNRAALGEHLAVLDAVLAGDRAAAQQALEAHLDTAYRTLMMSVPWDEG